MVPMVNRPLGTVWKNRCKTKEFEIREMIYTVRVMTMLKCAFIKIPYNNDTASYMKKLFFYEIILDFFEK